MKSKIEADKVEFLLSVWEGLIKHANSDYKTDVNKISEHILIRIFRILYKGDYEDLNKENSCNGIGRPNFPGVDTGWSNHDCISITSENTDKKILEGLKLFSEKNLIQYFPEGIRFFILKFEKPKPHKTKVKSYTFFDRETHVKCFEDLAYEIKELNNSRNPDYNEIIKILSEEFGFILQKLFSNADSDEKIINEVNTGFEKFENAHTNYDPGGGSIGKQIGTTGFIVQLVSHGNSHPPPTLERFLAVIHPMFLGLSQSLNKISSLKNEAEKNELLSMGRATFEVVSKNFNSLCNSLQTSPQTKKIEDIIEIRRQILSVLYVSQ